MTLSSIISWLVSAITFGTIILYGCLGETLTQKAGNLNLGTPGIMTLGGIGSVLAAFIYETSVTTPNPILCVVFATLGALILSGIGGLIYAFLTISLKCNQNVVGLTLTTFGTGVANFFGGILMSLSGGVGQVSLNITSSYFRTRIPFLSTDLGFISEIFFSHGFLFYVSIVIAISLNYFLNKTRVGLNLRAVGENAATADACGINVNKYRYLATLVGALISGLGGLYYSMDYIMGTWNNDGIIEAIGWLSLALVIFSSWKPIRSIFGALLFGICYWSYLYIPSSISTVIADTFNLTKANYLQNLYKGIPYLVTIIVLIIISKNGKKSDAPSNLGINYFREDR